jgi:hypothetical protein
MTRVAPASLSGLTVPVRTVRAAATVVCQECHSVVPTRDGAIGLQREPDAGDDDDQGEGDDDA